MLKLQLRKSCIDFHTPIESKSITMNRETDRWLQMNWLRLRNNMFKFKMSEKLPIDLEASMKYTSN